MVLAVPAVAAVVADSAAPKSGNRDALVTVEMRLAPWYKILSRPDFASLHERYATLVDAVLLNRRIQCQ